MPDTVSVFDLIRWSPLHLLIPLLAIQRILELRHAKRNEAWLRERGAVEHGAGHYALIVATHTIWFLAMIVEIILLSRGISDLWPVYLLLFLLAQGLRLWAIRSLGRQWNTKILVLPRAELVTGGPYRFMKHPNYVAVVVELLVFPLIYSAWLTAVTTTVINGVLLWVRIRAEDRALGRR